VRSIVPRGDHPWARNAVQRSGCVPGYNTGLGSSLLRFANYDSLSGGNRNVYVTCCQVGTGCLFWVVRIVVVMVSVLAGYVGAPG